MLNKQIPGWQFAQLIDLFLPKLFPSGWRNDGLSMIVGPGEARWQIREIFCWIWLHLTCSLVNTGSWFFFHEVLDWLMFIFTQHSSLIGQNCVKTSYIYYEILERYSRCFVIVESTKYFFGRYWRYFSSCLLFSNLAYSFHFLSGW